MKDATIDGTINATIAKQYTDWHVKTGGFARDKTLRDEFAGLAMQALVCRKDFEFEDWVWENAYDMADAMLKERAK
jgi:hypothetical protein